MPAGVAMYLLECWSATMLLEVHAHAHNQETGRATRRLQGHIYPPPDRPGSAPSPASAESGRAS